MLTSEHDRAWELLPWMVNGRLPTEDLSWLTSHVSGCADCTREVKAQKRIRDAVVSQPAVEFAPQASFNRLWARIEADAAVELPNSGAERQLPLAPRHSRLMQAGLAAQAATILILVAALWQARPAVPPSLYSTVTSPAPTSSVPGALEVVFDDAATLADVKALLTRNGLTTVSGPTPAGVYTLAPDLKHPTHAPGSVLEALRSDPRVRFAAPGPN